MKGMWFANVLLALAMILKYIAGAMLVTHFYADVAAAELLILTVIATLIFDDFCKAQGFQRQMLNYAFLSNLSIIGGMTLVVVS